MDRRGGGDNDGVRPAIEPRVRIGLFDESLHEGLLGYVAAAALLGVTLCGLVILARAKGAKPPPDLASIPKTLAATPANKVSDVNRSTKNGADILALTMANATTTLYMRAIQLNGVRYTLTIEFPNAYRELVMANKDRFFESFKLKAKS